MDIGLVESFSWNGFFFPRARLSPYKICQNKQHLQSPWETSKGKTLVYMYHSHFPPTQGGFKRCKVLNYKKYKLYPGWIMSPELKNIRVYPFAPGKSKPWDALFIKEYKKELQKINFRHKLWLECSTDTPTLPHIIKLSA